ncbi:MULTISPECIES: pyrimidine reductase family protein [unclassified Mycolicibacterium]|uniref:pyrimidine reductase family protein n=1 Tax=unclassified Mycolicibacterium TaxID=2636767 RepID=UPI0012DC40FE|nr:MULTISPECIES: pyrimidine reductase family protein [unclassified Mycolicibacterium]MUL80233.1 pyrimidine reductase family protein [Mycolicibacterium sp. CBMA 329]MUL86000.1 pyrimidine reductase family protein [Mycolicibacterium sp. CBMA 331]MUM00774.1 pyrimidine reductase family protein [Mycolicibacterium sp. CBMA 334]MUM28198.1 pyrimidine reductase family protein [Mycolicibacterium sp. CBMA 295]MUM36296.1 pyrimidine reductase family protein [Mycolicibacterium sp. CBMA 247]
MSDDTAGTDLTVLGNVDRIADGQLADYYTYPADLQRCWVRGNMISSLDGGATEDGKSGGLAGRGDRAVFNVMRQAADVILMGAATVRIENYSGVQLSVAQRQERQRRGQAEVPPIAVVTASAELDQDSKFFTRTEVPPLILTATRTVDGARHRLGAVAEVIDASGPDPTRVDPAVALRILAERKLFRVLTEGGPQLLSMLIENDLLDEMCLTVAPILLGGVARRIATGPGQAHTRMRPAHLLTDDEGYLYTRYVRG